MTVYEHMKSHPLIYEFKVRDSGGKHYMYFFNLHKNENKTEWDYIQERISKELTLLRVCKPDLIIADLSRIDEVYNEKR